MSSNFQCIERDRAIAQLRWDLLVEKSKEIGWPEAYQQDLTIHDQNTLLESPHCDYVWLLRECGTHLYPTQCETTGERDYCRKVIRYWDGNHNLNYNDGKPMARYFHVVGFKMKEITAKEAYDLIKVEAKEQV